MWLVWACMGCVDCSVLRVNASTSYFSRDYYFICFHRRRSRRCRCRRRCRRWYFETKCLRWVDDHQLTYDSVTDKYILLCDSLPWNNRGVLLNNIVGSHCFVVSFFFWCSLLVIEIFVCAIVSRRHCGVASRYIWHTQKLPYMEWIRSLAKNMKKDRRKKKS